MVNFSAKLQDNTREEWKEHYIDYKALKKALKPLKAGAKGKPWLKRGGSMVGGAGEASDSDEEAAGPPSLPPIARSLKERLLGLAGRGKANGGGGKGGGEGSGGDMKGPEGERVGLLGHGAVRSTSYDSMASEEGRLLATAHAEAEAGSPLSPDDQAKRQEGSERFESLLLLELQKVERFYEDTTTDLGQQLGFLKAQLRGDGNKGSQLALEDLTSWAHPVTEADKRRARTLGAKERDILETTLMRLNREMTLMENFCIINYTGFVKILKKHDKLMASRPLRPALLPKIEKTHFFRHQRLEAVKNEVTVIFADLFCNRDKNQAAAMLLPKRFRTNADYFLLHLGYKLGVAATLALWVVWDCVVQVAKFGKPTIVAKMGFPVFRAVGGLLLLHWCWGVLENACNYLRINFVYLLDLSPKNVSSPRKIFDEAVNESIVYLTCMLLYYKVLVGGFPDWIPAGFYPLILLVYTMTRLVFPLKQRMGIWVTVFRVMCAPLFSVTLLDTVVADMLTSLVKVLLDLLWSAFYFFSGDFLRDVQGADAEPGAWETSVLYSKVLAPLVVILPLWWRFMQCLRRYHDTGNRWPHLFNAAKYALAQTVTLFGAFHHVYYHRAVENQPVHRGITYDILWIGVTIVSTCYSYVWDVTMDWGLGIPSKRFLNDRRMYARDTPYYMAIAADLFLRFLWVNTLIPPNSGGLLSLPLYLNAFLMVMEILRRSFWGVLRLENEQLRNTQGFRRVDVIPLSFATESEHEYRDTKRQSNVTVILEVAAVAGLVVVLSIGAVMVADSIDQGAP